MEGLSLSLSLPEGRLISVLCKNLFALSKLGSGGDCCNGMGAGVALTAARALKRAVLYSEALKQLLVLGSSGGQDNGRGKSPHFPPSRSQLCGSSPLQR